MIKKSVAIALTALTIAGCDDLLSSDKKQSMVQERILSEGVAQLGMPAIKNFREKRLLKDIYELRDQTGILTYTYLWSDMQGKLVFFCESVGYGIPYATQYSAPEKEATIEYSLPQAEPNGLFSPSSAEGTWVMCKDPEGKDVRPVLVEPRTVVSPFKLKTRAVAND